MVEQDNKQLKADSPADGSAVVVLEERGSTRQHRPTRDLTSGSIPKNLFNLAWPQAVEKMVNNADQLLDILWAGRISAMSIAGLGVAQTYTSLALTGRTGFDMAMRAMVARAVGAKEIPLASHIALQAFTLSGAYSIIMVILGVFFTEPLLRLIGVSDSVVAAGAGYMRIQFIGQGTVAFRTMSGAALQAAGDPVTAMKATMVARIIHIALSPCLVFGLFVFPEMGLAGAAMANALAQLLGIGMNFYALFTGKSRLHLTLHNYHVDFPLLWQLVKIGLPASVTSAERTLAQLMLVGIVAPFGDFALAAYALTRRIESLANLGSQGLGQGTGILVGQCLGASKPERARTTVGWGVGFAVICNAVVGVIMLLFPEQVISIFNQQPELVGPAVQWLRISVFGWFIMGTGVIFATTYNISGNTLIPMVVTLASIWGVQQPLALVLPGWLNLQQFGIAWAVNCALVARLFIYIPYFFTGRWMKKNILAERKTAPMAVPRD